MEKAIDLLVDNLDHSICQKSFSALRVHLNATRRRAASTDKDWGRNDAPTLRLVHGKLHRARQNVSCTTKTLLDVSQNVSDNTRAFSTDAVKGEIRHRESSRPTSRKPMNDKATKFSRRSTLPSAHGIDHRVA